MCAALERRGKSELGHSWKSWQEPSRARCGCTGAAMGARAVGCGAGGSLARERAAQAALAACLLAWSGRRRSSHLLLLQPEQLQLGRGCAPRARGGQGPDRCQPALGVAGGGCRLVAPAVCNCASHQHGEAASDRERRRQRWGQRGQFADRAGRHGGRPAAQAERMPCGALPASPRASHPRACTQEAPPAQLSPRRPMPRGV